jgi:hypothetical protein
MFTVNTDDEVALSTMIINGGGRGTIVNVTGGTLTLDGGVTLTNCETAVDVKSGECNVGAATVCATQYSVFLESEGAFTLTPDEDGGTSVIGTVYLADEKSMVVSRVLCKRL